MVYYPATNCVVSNEDAAICSYDGLLGRLRRGVLFEMNENSPEASRQGDEPAANPR